MNKFVFIIGCYNSGTTLLNEILSHNDNFSCLHTEGINLTKQLKGPENYGWNRLWFKCIDKLEISKMFFKPSIDKLLNDWSPYFDKDKRYWVEKSVVNGVNIEWLEDVFNEPYFIYIIRNGYAVSEGIRRRTVNKKRRLYRRGIPYPIELCAEQWLVSNVYMLDKLSNVKNVFYTSYEELTDPTNEVLSKIHDWLDVPFSGLDDDYIFEFHSESQRILNLNSESIGKLSSADLDKIHLVASSLLDSYGY